MSKLLGIYGSPNEKGRSDRALDFLLKNVEAERAYIRGLDIKPCSGCLYCKEKRICKIKDDMEKLMPSLIFSEIIILSSPVYFKGLPSPLKAMIDRCQALWERKIERKHKGFFILTSEKKEDFPGCIEVIRAFFATIGARLIGGIILADNEPLEKIDKIRLKMIKSFYEEKE